MTADNGKSLPFLQLGGQDAEDYGTAEQRHTATAVTRMGLTSVAHPAQVGHQMALKGNVAPLVGEDKVHSRMESEPTRHTVPLPAQNPTIGVLKLIDILKGHYHVLAAVES